MTQINIWKNLFECDLTGYTLVIPSIAVGNVSQLASDLIISTLSMKEMALLYSPAIIPVTGYSPYNLDSSSLAASCSLYISEAHKIAILLLRAPLVHKYYEQFLTEVIDKFKSENIKDIIILTSSLASERKDVMTSPFRYVVNELCPYIERIKSLEWVEHEPRGNSPKSNTQVSIFGGGYGSMLFGMVTEKSLPCLVIYKFCSEGDNLPDSYEMAQYLNGVLKFFDEHHFYDKLIHPPSWKLLYGRRPPNVMY